MPADLPPRQALARGDDDDHALVIVERVFDHVEQPLNVARRLVQPNRLEHVVSHDRNFGLPSFQKLSHEVEEGPSDAAGRVLSQRPPRELRERLPNARKRDLRVDQLIQGMQVENLVSLLAQDLCSLLQPRCLAAALGAEDDDGVPRAFLAPLLDLLQGPLPVRELDLQAGEGKLDPPHPHVPFAVGYKRAA